MDIDVHLWCRIMDAANNRKMILMMGLVSVAIFASCCASDPSADRLDNTRARARSLVATESCSTPSDNCWKNGRAGACCDSGKTCFRKTAYYAQCKPACPSKKHGHLRSKPWICQDDVTCVHNNNNCRQHGVEATCCDAKLKCFKKNSFYGQCKSTCPDKADWECYKDPVVTTTSTPDEDTSASDGPCRPFLGKGINLGNRLEWQIKWGLQTKPFAASANPTFFAQEMWTPNRHDAHVFKEYKNKGFEWVRLPVSYNEHTDLDPPYTISAIWLASVRRHVQYALDNGLKVKINVHHENKKLSVSDIAKCIRHKTFKCRDGWMDVGSNKDVQNLPRLVAIWTQIAKEFRDVDAGKLVFEIFNEPHNFIALAPLNAAMRESLKAIRSSGGNNAKRIVYITGMRFSNPDWYTAKGGNVAAGNPARLHPDGFVVPVDKHLGLAVHSYDPFKVCGGGDNPASPTQSAQAWGMQRYRDALRVFKAAKDWASAHGIRHVALGEFGCSTNQKTPGVRAAYYEHTSKAAVDAGLSYAVWDDNRLFELLRFKNFDAEGDWDDSVVDKLADFPCASTPETTTTSSSPSSSPPSSTTTSVTTTKKPVNNLKAGQQCSAGYSCKSACRRCATGLTCRPKAHHYGGASIGICTPTNCKACTLAHGTWMGNSCTMGGVNVAGGMMFTSPQQCEQHELASKAHCYRYNHDCHTCVSKGMDARFGALCGWRINGGSRSCQLNNGGGFLPLITSTDKCVKIMVVHGRE